MLLAKPTHQLQKRRFSLLRPSLLLLLLLPIRRVNDQTRHVLAQVHGLVYLQLFEVVATSLIPLSKLSKRMAPLKSNKRQRAEDKEKPLGAKGDPWWGSVVETQGKTKTMLGSASLRVVSSLCPKRKRERRRPAIASGESPPTSTKHSPNAGTKKVPMLCPAGRVQQCSKEVQCTLSHGKEGLAGSFTHTRSQRLSFLSSQTHRQTPHFHKSLPADRKPPSAYKTPPFYA